MLGVEMPLAVFASFFGLSAAQHCCIWVDLSKWRQARRYPLDGSFLSSNELAGRHYFVAVDPLPVLR